MLTPEQLNSSVDAYSGTVNIPFSLVSIQGRNGLDLQLGMSYNSQVQEEASTWNLDAPTGVAGLGWQLGRSRIFADLGNTGNVEDNTWFIQEGVSLNQLIPTAQSNGIWQFETSGYQFWKIQYDPHLERWEIIKEDGTTYVFGDRRSQQNTLEYSVANGNWIGATQQTQGQQQVVHGWNLYQVFNRFGDLQSYTYKNVEVATGQPSGLVYTQASYLTKITGVAGNWVELRYASKNPNEYIVPNQDPYPPNAWQDIYETQFLSGVVVFSDLGTQLYEWQLRYEKFLGNGNLTKRLLTSLRKIYPGSNAYLSPSLFDYYNSSDEVGPTNPYSSPALYGAIKKVTLPEGGEFNYSYGSVQPHFGNRELTVVAVAQSGYTFSEPRFYFGLNYAVATWLGKKGSDYEIQVQAFTWAGRWIQQSLDNISLSAQGDYAKTQVICETGFFGLYVNNQVHLYHQNAVKNGEWVQPNYNPGSGAIKYFPTAFSGSESVAFASGDRFVSLVGKTSGKLYYFQWNGTGWVHNDEVNLSGGSGTAAFGLAADNNYFLTVRSNPGTGNSSLDLNLYVINALGSWQAATNFSKTISLENINGINMVGAPAFAAGQFQAGSGSSLNYETVAFNWSEDFTTLTPESLNSKSSVSSVPSLNLRKNLVAYDQHLFSYDGVSWQKTDASTIGTGAGDTLQSIEFGVDKALRTVKDTSNKFVQETLVYNPNLATSPWSVSSGMSKTNSSAALMATNESEEHNDNFIVFNSSIYYQEPSSNWVNTGVSLPALTGDDAKSLQVMLSGYLVFQHSGKVEVYRLKNGSAVNTPIELTGKKIYSSGMQLVGETAFVGFTGTYGDASSVMTLYQTAADQVEGAISVHPVVTMTMNSQYQQIPTAYQYDTNKAVASISGYGLFSAKTTLISGSADGSTTPIGKTELQYFNGLSPTELPGYYPTTAGCNAGDYYSVVQGNRYQSLAYEDGNNTAISTSADYLIVYPKALAANGNGYYNRLAQNISVIDGISTKISYDYATETGLVSKLTNYNYNSDGVEEQIISLFRYFWQEYDTSRSLNLLTPIAQHTKQSKIASTVKEIANRIVTFKENWGFGNGQWAPYLTYRSVNATPNTFNQWDAPTTTPPTGWLVYSKVLSRTSHSQVLDVENILGVISSMTFNKQETLPIASVQNGSLQTGEANYYGFQVYEELSGWGWNGGGGSIEDHITTSDYFTGDRCLELPSRPGKQEGPVHSFWPSGQDRVYVFSTWVKTQKGFDPANGTAKFVVGAYKQSDASLVSNQNLAIPTTSNQWQKIQQVISLANIRSAAGLPTTEKLYLRISGYNQNSQHLVLVDSLQFSPSDAIFSGTVYNAATELVTARQDNNAEVSRVTYDRFNRVVSETLPGELIDYVRVNSLSRDINPSGTFNDTYPNSTLQLATTSDSDYYDFHDASNSDWTYTGSQTGKWAIQNGELQFSGYNHTDLLPSQAVLNLYAFTNFAVRVVVTDHQSDVGVSNGEITVYWDESAQTWTLAKKKSAGGGYTYETVATSQITGFRSDWVFAVIDGLAFFYADGIQVFSYQLPSENTGLPNYGKPTLLCNQSTSFDDLIVLNNPQLSVAFYDGVGSFLQNLQLEGLVTPGAGESPIYRTINSGVLYDDLGNPYVERNPESPSMSTSDTTYLLEGSPDQYLLDPEGNSVTRAQYLAGTNGYGYTKRTYEASPLNRQLTVVLPREAGLNAAHFTYTHAYSSATTTICKDILPDEVVGHYSMIEQTDPQGMSSYVVTDQRGNKILQRQVKGGTIQQTIATQYDSSDNVTQIKLPNYFVPPNGSAAGSWVETRKYTFDNLLREQTTPDTGTTKLIYDDLMRQRFIMDADGAALSPQRIKYIKYDNLDRVLEEGYIQDASFQWGADGATLQAKANDQSWPNLASVSGKWEKRTFFDLDTSNSSAPVCTHLLGRVWKNEFNNNATETTPDYQISSYNDRGLILSLKTLILSDGADPYLCSYTYNNLGDPTSITYPAIAANVGSALKVGYFYNRLGQVASVGIPLTGNEVIDPSNPATAAESKYGAYFYHPDGSLYQEKLNNNQTPDKSILRTMTYNVPGLLTQISDDFMTQDISYYEKPGYEGVNYYNGNISNVDMSYGSANAEPIPAYANVIGYDSLSRMTAAQNSLSDGLSYYSGSPANTATATYDANNNIQNASRGTTLQAYDYHESGGGTPTNNQLLKVTSSVNTSIDFTETPHGRSIWPWTWGANNGGASDTAIVDKTPSGKALKLGGGSLGHFEFLSLNSYLDPGTKYTLNYDLLTPTGFSDGVGEAGWFLVIETTEGTSIQKLLQAAVDTSNAWSFKTLNIDLPALLSGIGLGKTEVSLNLEFRNYLRNSTGSGAGPDIQLTSITLTSDTNVGTGNYTYDANGNVQEVPDLHLSNFEYDAFTNLTKSFRINGASGNKQSYVYGINNQQTFSSYKQNSGTNIKSETFLFGLGEHPLAVRTKLGTVAATEKQFIYGPTGLIAVKNTTSTYYCLSDHQGSNRMMVDKDRNVYSTDDYLPYGGFFRESGTTVNPYLYTSQEHEEESDLYHFQSRFYHPGIRRFLAPDPANTDVGSYNYVQNSPFQYTDPSGNAPELAQGENDASLPQALIVGALTFYGARRAGVGGLQDQAKIGMAATGIYFMAQTGNLLSALTTMAISTAAGVVYSFTGWKLGRIMDMNTHLSFLPTSTFFAIATVGMGGVFRNSAVRWWRDEQVSEVQEHIAVNRTILGVNVNFNVSFSTTYRDDFISSVVTHMIFEHWDIRSAINPAVGYNNAQSVNVIYLKFPSGFKPHKLNWWRGWIIPYIGRASGRPDACAAAIVRHNGHHWNDYGFGPFMVLSATADNFANEYLERWSIWYRYFVAYRIEGVPGVQARYTVHNAWAWARQPAAIREYLIHPVIDGAWSSLGTAFRAIMTGATDFFNNRTLFTTDAVDENKNKEEL